MTVLLVGIAMFAIGLATSPFAKNNAPEWRIAASGGLTGFGICVILCGASAIH